MQSESRWPFMPGRGTRVSHAEGAYLYLEDGSKILDAAGGAIVSNIGHGRRRVADAIHKATINCSYAVPPWITPEVSTNGTASGIVAFGLRSGAATWGALGGGGTLLIRLNPQAQGGGARDA